MKLALLVLLTTAAHAESIVVTATHVPLHQSATANHDLDALHDLGAVELTSRDSRFGGLSGIVASPTDPDTYWFVADCGYFVSLHVVRDAGSLVGVDHAELAPMRDPLGKAIGAPSVNGLFGCSQHADAEELARLRDGRWLVSMEQDATRLIYPAVASFGALIDAKPVLLDTVLPEFVRDDPNHGIEAMATLPDGRVLAFGEGVWAKAAPVRAFRGWFISVDSAIVPLATLPADGELRPSGACTTPDGHVIVIDRHYDRAKRHMLAKLRMIRAKDVIANTVLKSEVIATFDGDVTRDNFEGITAQRINGQTVLTLVSDNNYRSNQRTLLMQFTLQSQ